MAIIGKIRDNGWLVLIVIGIALMAFIMGDWSKITGGNEPVYGIGTIYGEKVDDKKFSEAVEIARTNAIQTAQQQGQRPQEVDENRVWRSFVEEQLLEKEYEALGIEVGDDEFDAYLYAVRGFDPQAEFLNSPAFTDSITNAFSPKKLETRVNEMRESAEPEQVKAWKNTEDYYKKKRRQEKYFDILGQGIYITDLEAKNEFLANNEKKSISYVVKRFRDLLDSDYEKGATDTKLKAYFEEHKNDKKYQVKENTRRLHFFEISIEPSEADIKNFDTNLDRLKAEFIATTNDSAFVVNRKNSDLRFYTSGPFSTAIPKSHRKAQDGRYITYPDGMDEAYQNAVIGDVVGPYEFNGSSSMGKVIGFTSDTINARHILISVAEGDDVAAKEALADSLLKEINNDNFEAYVSKHSGDTGSAEKGGDLGDFFFGDMVPQFATYVADKPIGEIGVVQTQFGFHIIQVTARKGKKYPRLAIVQKTLKPSKETIKAIEEEAYNLLYKLDEKLSNISDPYKRVERFDTIAKRGDYFSKTFELKDNAPAFTNFNTRYAEDKLLDLVFKDGSEVGTLVNSPIKDKSRYIIAIFAGKIEKGTPKFEDIKRIVKQDYIKDLKVKKFKSEMKSKKLTDIKGKGISVMKAEVTMANTQLSGAGFEPKVVGAVFAILKDGGRSLPIEGNTGVFVVKVEKTLKAVAAKDYDVEKKKLANAIKAQLQNSTRRSLTKLGDVVDNRRLFNTGVRR
ncbi:MAG: peptidylprolyl isomerase [Crocinitomicaceae bacterium]|nr:peptidylprolyl isomerase [Flavobacteriales bacterium]NQZ36382.1 peptidylprolyl isomerase [Crocinitomicaceae bacterium]